MKCQWSIRSNGVFKDKDSSNLLVYRDDNARRPFEHRSPPQPPELRRCWFITEHPTTPSQSDEVPADHSADAEAEFFLDISGKREGQFPLMRSFQNRVGKYVRGNLVERGGKLEQFVRGKTAEWLDVSNRRRPAGYRTRLVQH